VDNGKIYISDDFKLICAKLGITLKYSTPYKPSGKGKIEVFWKYVESSFMPELRLAKISNIFELNDIFQGWLQEEYLNKKHSSLDNNTPIERWEASIKNGTKLRFCSPVQLDEAFLHTVERTVTKYGTISFEGNTYEIDGYLVGKKITIRYNPFHLDYVHVHFNDKYFGTAKIIDLKNEKHKSVGHLEEDPCVDSEISKQYLNSIKSRYQNYLSEQIKLNINSDNIIIKDSDKSKEDAKKAAADEPHGFRPPSEIEFSIARKEFLEIIAASLNIETFTFAEKGKLYELWDTFKDFNKDILVGILADIKEKSDSYNSNFLYYLTQLKNLYISKLNAEKRKEGVDTDEHKNSN
jgi:putative transposase